MSFLPGETVSHYTILQHLGGGGMGVVYEARDLKLDRPVALKFLPPELTRDPEAKERLIHEGRAASALQQSNICVVYDIDETDDGQVFICMEYLEGETLKQRIQNSRHRAPGTGQEIAGLSAPEALGIAVQAAHGLAAAHARGIVHRDIKPANIMVTKEGVAKIVDFGLAKLTSQAMITKAGSTLGTAAYMSPEQTRGDAIDHRTDIWSLGVVLYQMLTGELPFRGDFEQGIIYSILNEKPQPLTGLTEKLRQRLDTVVQKALEKQPSDRYGSVQEMTNDLLAIMETPEGKTEGPRLSLLRKTGAKKIIVLAAISIAVLGALTMFIRPKSSNTTGPGTPPLADTQKNSIAVLPFTDYSPGKDQEYFCSGIAEEMTTVLSQIPDLKVVSRTRAFALTKNTIDPSEMGRQLGVATVLGGSVRKDGNQLRITAQLTNVTDGVQIWTDTYDRTLQDIFSIQKEVALSVAAALKITLASQTAERLVPRQTASVEAYERWLRGAYFVKLYLVSYREQDIQSAIQMFEAAIASDSTYALAYGGMAWAYEHRYVYSGHKNLADREQVVRCIENAYRLDSLSGSLNAGMAYLASMKGDYDEAYHFCKTALALEPRSLFVNHLTAEFLAKIGLNKQSEKFYARAIASDPYYLLSIGEAAGAFELEAEFEKAASYYRRALDLSPNDRIYRSSFINFLIKTGKLQEATRLLQKATKADPEYPGYARCSALIHASRGEREQALKFPHDPEILTMLGMRQEALRILEHLEGRSEVYQYQALATNPRFEVLHGDPRFQAMLSRQNEVYKDRLTKYGDL